MKKKATNATINVRGTAVAVVQREGQDYISLTDMLRAKDGDFFISDWLRNRNTVEFLGIRETVHNPDFNSAEFALMELPQGDRLRRLNAIAIRQMQTLTARTVKQLAGGS